MVELSRLALRSWFTCVCVCVEWQTDLMRDVLLAGNSIRNMHGCCFWSFLCSATASTTPTRRQALASVSLMMISAVTDKIRDLLIPITSIKLSVDCRGPFIKNSVHSLLRSTLLLFIYIYIYIEQQVVELEHNLQ